MKRSSLTLNLKNDLELIRQYRQLYKEVWTEIINSIKDSGIENMPFSDEEKDVIFGNNASTFYNLEI
ncbi:MAG TPA: L-rhamnose mutarotase [Hanamia sp.]|nr:L-rhamnose mutarotase [Hanamia sp.]